MVPYGGRFTSLDHAIRSTVAWGELFGPSAVNATVLCALALGSGPRSQSEIQTLFTLPAHTVRKALGDLRALHLVEASVPPGDRRGILYSLSAEGVRRLSQVVYC